MNTSATGGYLQPTIVTDQNDQVLHRFLQQLVSGVTGIDGKMVRPRWQPEPANIPEFGIDWCAVGESQRSRDAFSTSFANNDLGIEDSIYRNEELEILCSFYGPNAEANSEKLAVGLQIGQNREQMQLNGCNLISVGTAVITADLLHERWVRRVDVPFNIRRAQEYSYGILDLTGVDMEIEIKDDSGNIDDKFLVDGQSVTTAPVFGADVQSEFIQGWDAGNWR